MNCEDCPHKVRPFNYCRNFKWALKDKHTEIKGCTIDGVFPPLPRDSLLKMQVEGGDPE